jgi:H+/Cl- antiporter ClcA
MARWFIIAGIILLVIGLVLHFAPGLVQWFGKLPGDLHWRSERTQVFVPITSMIIISIVLTILLNLFNR